MKKLLIVLTLLLSLVACGESGPKKIVTNELKTIQSTNLDETLAALNIESLSTSQQAYIKQLYKLVCEFDYEILNVVEDDDKATIEVKINTFDIAEAFSEIESDSEILSVTQELNSNYTQEKEEELMARYAIKITQILNANEKTNSATLTVPCVKTNGEWAIDSSYNLKSEVAAVATSTLVKISDTGE